jgi:hypothetical protein
MRANTALGSGVAINYIKKGKNSRSSVNSMNRKDDDKFQTTSKRSHSS